MTAFALRALGLGDLITGLPALRLLGAALPRQRILLGAPRSFAPLIELAGTVDQVVHARGLAPLDAPLRDLDIAVNLHGRGPQSTALLRSLAPRRLVAFGLDGWEWRDDEHEVARWCRLVSEAFDLDLPVPPLAGSLRVPDIAVPQGLAIVHPGAAFPSRRWPPQRFAALAILLRRRGHDVVVTGGPDEARLAEAVATAAGVRARTGMSLVELLALVANARLVVSGDTGVAHVATVYAVPSVVLFGPVSPATWGPPRHTRHRVLWHGDVHDGRGDPHGRRLDPALAAISVREACAACDQALSRHPGE